MEHVRHGRTRGGSGGEGRPVSRNRKWVAAGAADSQPTTMPTLTRGGVDGERWERGSGRRRGGRSFGRGGLGRGSRQRRFDETVEFVEKDDGMMVEEVDMDGEGSGEREEEGEEEVEEPILETQEERDKFWQELVKAREVERKEAIAQGKMDDPSVPKRLEDAITLVGTCTSMCPRFERYRRERENNLFELECIPGTKRVDHKRCVKIYERAAGDKTLPSDLRPPPVLRRTLDYLFHDLLPRGGLQKTAAFIRDRSRAVRNDFTMQHETGPIAMDCHDRCVRFHLLVMHLQRDQPGFSPDLEEQQLMNSLQSLKEFYEDQRSHYESPNELEMRIYHRLIHIRDQRERHDDVPESITHHLAFQLTTRFRLHVQNASAPITKKSPLVVGAEGMRLFAELAGVLRAMGNQVMCYLVACILERLFGKDTVDDIEALRGNLSLQDIIDGVSEPSQEGVEVEPDEVDKTAVGAAPLAPAPIKSDATGWAAAGDQQQHSIFGPPSQAPVSLVGTPNNGLFTQPKSIATNSFPPSSRNGSGLFGTTTTANNDSNNFTNAASSSAFSKKSNIFDAPSVFNKTTPSSSAPSEIVAPRSVFGASAEGPKSVFPSVPQTSTLGFASASTNGFASSSSSSSVFGARTASAPSLMASSPFSQPSSVFGSAAKPFQAQSSQVRPPPSVFTPTSTPPLEMGSSSSKPSLVSQKEPPPSVQVPLNPKAPAFTPIFSSLSNVQPSAPSVPPIDATSIPEPAITPASLVEPKELTGTTKPGLSSVPPVQPGSSTNDTGIGALPATNHSSSGQALTALPKIITNTPHVASTSSASPRVPPPLPKPHPISLPPTPGINSPLPLSATLKSAVMASPSRETLSPLLVLTPTTSRPLKGVSSVEIQKESTASAMDTWSLVISPSSKATKEALADAESRARALTGRGWLVKQYFSHWVQRATTQAEWREVCRRSDAYQQQVQLQRSSSRLSPADKKQRSGTANSLAIVETPRLKRSRRRVSSEYRPPRTDEELAKRLRENQEEHQRRWASGSFLEELRTHVLGLSASPPSHWRTWVSVNPENDGTAIWLERKFNIPTSGQWESENAFSIPLTTATPTLAPSPPSPGIIIFECTPLEGVTDDIEKKYRVLDDCSRMRDIIQALPPRRHFVPSILAFNWAEDNRPDPPINDFVDMLAKFEEQGVVGRHHIFSITSSSLDLDRRFLEALTSLNLDVEGRLVERLTLFDLFRFLDPPWQEFVVSRTENLSGDWDFESSMLGKILEASIKLVNAVGESVLSLLRIDADFDPLPPLDISSIMDPESACSSAGVWLASLPDASMHPDLHSHFNITNEFPAAVFLDHLHHLVLDRTEAIIGTNDAHAKFPILKTDMSSIGARFREIKEDLASGLRLAESLLHHRSSKRRSLTGETDSIRKRPRFASPESSAPSPELSSLDISPLINGRPSPDPSIMSVATLDEKPFITIAMLRQLTKDVKQKYAR